MNLKAKLLLCGGAIAGVVAIGVAWWRWPVSRDEQAVFLAIVEQEQFEARAQAVTRRTTLDDMSGRTSDLAWCFRQRKVNPELIRDFERANRFQASIPSSFSARLAVSDSHGPVAVISRWLDENPFDSCLYRCSNHLRFSRAGFSQARDIALVSIDFHCPICGYGGFMLLEKDRARWKVVDRCSLWVS